MIGYRSGCLRAAIVAAVLLGGIGSVSAGEPSSAQMKIALEIIKVKGAANLYEPVLINIIEKAKYTFMQANPMLSSDLDAAAIQVRRDLQPQLDAMRDEVARLYASHFTEAELKAILTFYQSPVGAKLIVTEPKVVNESMAYANRWAAKLQDQVLAKMREEMHKRGHDL